MDALHRHRSLYKGTTPPWKETYRKVRKTEADASASSLKCRDAVELELPSVRVRVEKCPALCVSVCFAAVRRPTEKQPVEAPGEVSPGGREPAARRLRGLCYRPGGDGGGVDRPAVRGPQAALAVGAAGHGRGRSLPLLSVCLFLYTRVSLPITKSVLLILCVPRHPVEVLSDCTSPFQ